MKTSHVIALCVLSGAACGLLGAVMGAHSEDGHTSSRGHAAQAHSMGGIEIREDLQALRRSIDHLIKLTRRSVARETPTLAQDAVRRGGEDDPAQRRELDAETEEIRKQALARIGQMIEAQQQATAQALKNSAQRQTTEDMVRYTDDVIRERGLERKKKLISQSQDIVYLRKMVDAK